MTLETDCSLVVTIPIHSVSSVISARVLQPDHPRSKKRIKNILYSNSFNLEPENKCHRRHTSDNHHHTYFSSTNNPHHYQLSSPSHTIHPSTSRSYLRAAHLRTRNLPQSKREALTSNRALLPLACFHKTRATRPPRRQRNSNDSTSTSSKGIKHKTSYLPLRAFHVLYCEQN